MIPSVLEVIFPEISLYYRVVLIFVQIKMTSIVVIKGEGEHYVVAEVV